MNPTMDRQKVSIARLGEEPPSSVPGSPAYRVGLVWPLTVEAVSLSRRYDAEQRLQRHVVRLVRRKG